MRVVIILSSVICLFSVSVPADKVKRQATFDFGFGQNQQVDLGQIIGGLFGSGGCSVNNGGCEHGCRVIRGRRQCYCREGYHLHIHDGSCGDTNECAEFHPCQERCENTIGSYNCYCSSGTVQPDGSCSSDGFVIGGGNNGQSAGGGEHINGHGQQSCSNGNGGCEQICRQFRNGVQCECEPGFSPSPQNPNSCQDVDECAEGFHRCQNRCINTVGSYSCMGISFPSPIVTGCANGNGGCEQTCRDTRNGVQCRCSRQMILLPDGKTCGCAHGSIRAGGLCLGPSNGNVNTNLPINCDLENGGCDQRCRKPRNRRGRHRCVCNKRNFALQDDKRSCACTPGYTISPNGRQCLASSATTGDVVSCAVNNGGCQQRCVTARRGDVCRCTRNSQLQPDQKSCACNEGYSLSANGRRCNVAAVVIPPVTSAPQQLDPCAVNKGGCHHICQANGNQPQCYCNDLYSLAPDGISCIPQDPCMVNNGGCNHICANNNGQASCSCKSGWQLSSNGRGCQEIPKPNVPTTTKAPRQGCGVNNKKDLLRRIVGGKPADPKDWPWMAAILRKNNQDQFCGGVLITDRHVLTASHCLVDFKKEEVLVRLGEYDFSSTTENNPTDFAVVDIRLHEGYNRSSQLHDIALMKLDRPSSFSEFIWPVCLPPPSDNFMNQLGYVTGWGSTSFGGKVSRVLQEVIVPVWAQAECSSAYPDKVAPSMMCAGLREGGKDSCQGDSGGPFLVQIYPSSRWFVIGVVSWGIKCAEAGNPGVYTRVNEYLPWIRENAVF